MDDGNGRMSCLLTLLLPLARRENDYVSFVTYRLGVILAAYRELSERVRMVGGNTRKPNRVRDIIKIGGGRCTSYTWNRENDELC